MNQRQSHRQWPPSECGNLISCGKLRLNCIESMFGTQKIKAGSPERETINQIFSRDLLNYWLCYGSPKGKQKAQPTRWSIPCMNFHMKFEGKSQICVGWLGHCLWNAGSTTAYFHTNNDVTLGNSEIVSVEVEVSLCVHTWRD